MKDESPAVQLRGGISPERGVKGAVYAAAGSGAAAVAGAAWVVFMPGRVIVWAGAGSISGSGEAALSASCAAASAWRLANDSATSCVVRRRCSGVGCWLYFLLYPGCRARKWRWRSALDMGPR
jgi:hypothetical protein